MKISKLELRNITSYTDAYIDLTPFIDNSNIVLLNGRTQTGSTNGSGKSSIVYSILTALNCLSNYKSLRSIDASDDSLIALTIFDSKTNKEVNITRIFNKTKSTLNINTNDKDDLIFLRIKDNESFLKEKLHLTDIFFQTHFFTNANESVYDLSSTQLFNFLERILNIENIDKINNLAKNKLKDLKSEYDINVAKIEMNKKLILNHENNIKELINKKSINVDEQIEKFKEKLKKLYNQLCQKEKEIQGNNIPHQLCSSSLNNINDLFNNIDNYITSIRASIHETEQRLNELNKHMIDKSSEEKTIKGKVSELTKLKSYDICPTCKQKINFETKTIYESLINENINKLNKTVNEVSELDKQIKGFKHNIKCYREILELLNDIKLEKNNFDNFLNSVTKERNIISEEIKKHENEISKLKSEVEQLENVLKNINNDLTIYNIIVDLTKSKSIIRQKYLYEVFEQLKSLTLEFADIFEQDEVFDFDFDFEKNNVVFGIRKKNILKPFKLLSTGEKKKTSIVLIFTILKILNLFNQESSLRILVFDDFFNGLDTTNTQNILNLIYQFANKYNYQVFISNNNIEKIDFPTIVIDIEKQDDFSVIQNISLKDFV